MESKKGKSAVCWIYQYSKKSLWLVILLALISGAIAGSFILLALVSSSLLDVATGVKEGTLGQALPDEAVVGRYHRAFGIIRGRFVADPGQACGRGHP